MQYRLNKFVWRDFTKPLVLLELPVSLAKLEKADLGRSFWERTEVSCRKGKGLVARGLYLRFFS